MILCIITFSLTTLCIMTLIMTINITMKNTTLRMTPERRVFFMQSIEFFNCCAKYRYAACHYAQCRRATFCTNKHSSLLLHVLASKKFYNNNFEIVKKHQNQNLIIFFVERCEDSLLSLRDNSPLGRNDETFMAF